MNTTRLGAPSQPWWCIYRVGEALPAIGPDAHLDAARPVLAWLTTPSAAHAVAERWLSADEAARLATMQHPRARAEFLTGRWLIRGILGRLLGLAPTDVPIVATEAGSLAVESATPLVFNLSHTDGLVALVVAPHGELGVDVEWTTRPGRTVELADRYFAKAEVAALRALPETAQRRRFFQLWTLKEAYIKARGLGLRIPLHSFAFDLDDSAPAIETHAESGDASQGWVFCEGAVAPERHLALAWRPSRG